MNKNQPTLNSFEADEIISIYYWDESDVHEDNIHSDVLHYDLRGVEIVFKSGRLLSIQSTGEELEISYNSLQIDTWDNDVKKYDMSSYSFFSKILNHPITSIALWLCKGNLQEVTFDMDNSGYLLFSASEASSNPIEIVDFCSNELVVVTDKKVAIKFGLERFSKEPFIRNIKNDV